MNTQHTPGEWIINKHSATTVELKNSNRSIASTGSFQTNTKDAEAIYYENIANARLIAAAPDLLEALDGILKAREGWFCKTQEQFDLMANAVDKANAAIQKATK